MSESDQPTTAIPELGRPGPWAGRAARRPQAGLIERVWRLSPDRLARVHTHQLPTRSSLDELARHGVSVGFTDAPPLDDDPQGRLLTQVQRVIAEYERAKIAERYRRGKLFRSGAGEVLAWRTPYGYRRQPRAAHGPARLEVFEPEAAIVRRIFADYVHGRHFLREIIRRLAADAVPPPAGRGAAVETSPITRQSGRKCTVSARFVHNDRLVDALTRQAQAAISASLGALVYYDQLRARGIGHQAGLRQLANRQVGILHGCLASGRCYLTFATG